MSDILDKCFILNVHIGIQPPEIIEYVKRVYGDDIERLWEKFPENAIARRKDNQKWYLALMNVSRRKIGQDSDELITIIDLRESPEWIAENVDGQHYFSGFHMNKKHWYTIPLDGILPTEEICRRLDASYALAVK